MIYKKYDGEIPFKAGDKVEFFEQRKAVSRNEIFNLPLYLQQ